MYVRTCIPEVYVCFGLGFKSVGIFVAPEFVVYGHKFVTVNERAVSYCNNFV